MFSTGLQWEEEQQRSRAQAMALNPDRNPPKAIEKAKKQNVEPEFIPREGVVAEGKNNIFFCSEALQFKFVCCSPRKSRFCRVYAKQR
jgi:hypothetical protein